MKIQLFVICFLTLVSAGQIDDDEAATALEQMEKSQFGRSLLDTIQLQLQAGDQVQDLIHLLQDIEEGLEEEQDQDDEFIEKLQQECDENLAKIKGEIESAELRIEDLESELAEKIPIRDMKVKQLEDKKRLLVLLEEKLAELEVKKEEKEAEWKAEQEEHDQAQYVIERAREIIQGSLMEGSSFLQKESKKKMSVSLLQVSDHFNQHADGKTHDKSWSSIFKVLAQISANAPVQADAEGVQKIIDLCEELLAKIAESREIERKDFENWIDEYRATKEAYTKKHEETADDISKLGGEIATLNTRIQNAQTELKEQQERVVQKKQQADEKLIYCDDQNKSYAERREKRSDERHIVSDAIKLIQAKLRTLREYVSERMKGK